MQTRYTDEQLRKADEFWLKAVRDIAPSKEMGGYVEFSINGKPGVKLTYADRLACEAELKRRRKAKGAGHE
jgi:hypothetical protein